MAVKDLIFNVIARDGASATFAKVGAEMDTLAAKTQAAGKKITKVGSSLNRTGRELSEAVTLPLAAIGYESVKAAASFQESMLRIHTHVDAPMSSVKKLSSEVLQLAQTAQQGPNQLADALYHLKSVGLDDADAMTALKDSSDLAALGGANLEQTASALAAAWRSGIKGAQNFGQETALLNSIIGQGNMQTQDLVDAMGTGFLSTAKTFGAGLRDVGASLAVLTDSGTPAQKAATRLRMSISLMGAPSAAAAKALGQIGLKSTDLAHAMRGPRGLVGAIELLHDKLKDSGKSATAQAQILSEAFGGGRSSGAILTLVNNVSALDSKYRKITPDVQKLNDAVAQQRKTPVAQWHEFASQMESVGITIGQQLIPKLEQIGKWVKDAAEWFAGLNPHIRSAAIDFGLFAAALGPVLFVGGALGRSFGQLVTGISRLAGWASKIPGLFNGWVASNTAVASSDAALAAAQADLWAATQTADEEMIASAQARVDAIAAADAEQEAASEGVMASLGPVGLAIGGVALAVSLLRGHQAAAAPVVESYGSAFDDATGSINDNTSALARNIDQVTAKALAQGNLGAALRSAHANIQLLVRGLRTQAGALNNYIEPLKGQGGQYVIVTKHATAFTNELNRLAGVMGNKQFAAFLKLMQGQAGALKNSEIAAQFTAAALGPLGDKTQGAGGAASSSSGWFSSFGLSVAHAGDASGTAAGQVQDLGTALNNAFGVLLGTQQATDALASDFDTLSTAVVASKQKGDDMTKIWTIQDATARQVRSGMDSVIQGAGNLVVAYQQTGAPAQKVWEKSQQVRQSLYDQSKAAGLSDQAIWILLGTYDAMLKRANIHKTVSVDTGDANSKLQALIGSFERLGSLGRATLNLLPPSLRPHATGGFLDEGYNLINERGPELLRKSGSQVEVFTASQTRHMLAPKAAATQPTIIVQQTHDDRPIIVSFTLDGREVARGLAKPMRREIGELERASR